MAVPAVPAAPGDERAPLREVDAVYWRPRMDARRLGRRAFAWRMTTLAHVIPFCATGVVLLALNPITLPVALAAFAHAYLVPMAYANRGAGVVRPRVRRRGAIPAEAERTAIGLLGDLVGHEARELHARTGLVMERGRLGVWLVGPTGALLVDRGGRRTHCWCVKVDQADLPDADRISHLLLALREDEEGFATVANLAFTGATWRIRRRMKPEMRPALVAAAAAAKARA